MKTKIFCGNLADDVHCLQACYWMAMNTLLGQDLKMAEIETATGFREGWPTWPFASMLSFANQGFEVVYIENTDYAAFVDKPKEILLKQVGDPAILDEVLQVTDLPLETARVSDIFKHPHADFEKRVPTLADLRQKLDEGWLCICNVNAYALYNEEGYEGHAVVVDTVTDDEVILQDPGLPPLPDLKVSHANFLAAWNYPNENMANIFAIKRR